MRKSSTRLPLGARSLDALENKLALGDRVRELRGVR